jgi:hypothetical protein
MFRADDGDRGVRQGLEEVKRQVNTCGDADARPDFSAACVIEYGRAT